MKRYKVPILERLFEKHETKEFWFDQKSNELSILLHGYQKRDENDKFVQNNCWENLLILKILLKLKELFSTDQIEIKPDFWTCLGGPYDTDDIDYGLTIWLTCKNIIIPKNFEITNT